MEEEKQIKLTNGRERESKEEDERRKNLKLKIIYFSHSSWKKYGVFS